jgi:hypothetical protein
MARAAARVFARTLPFCAAALFAAASAAADVQRIAVFMGIDQGLEDERPLRYASRDAREMAETFRRAGTFDEDRIYTLINAPLDKIMASLEEVKGRVRELNKAGTESLVLIYYSGHGSAEGLHVQGRNFAREDLARFMESLESNMKILILDACESGDFLRHKGGRIVQDEKVVKLDRLESKGTVVISSSSRGEMAQESEDYRGAVFTHHFLNGMRGLADYDGDKSIRLMEAFDYARVSTRREEIFGAASQQNPEFDFDLTGESDPVMARIASQQCRLKMEGMPAGPLEIYNGNTMQLESKVWLTGRDSANFTLPSNKYILAYGEKNASRILEVDMTWQKQAVIRPEVFRKKAKSLLYGKGGGRSLDLHFHGTQVSMRQIDAFDGLLLNQIGYVYRDYWTKQTLSFSLGGATLKSGAVNVKNSLRLYGVGYAMQVPVLRGLRGQVLAGGEASWHRMVQTLTDSRFPEAPIQPDGTPVPAEREVQANLYRAGIPLEAEAYFPFRLWASLSVTGGMSLYQNAAGGGFKRSFGWEPAVAIGHQF